MSTDFGTPYLLDCSQKKGDDPFRERENNDYSNKIRKGGNAMCYVCGKSRNKIFHEEGCRYVGMIPEKNRKYFNSVQSAVDKGYVRCKYCTTLKKRLEDEKTVINRLCSLNGIHCDYNPTDGYIDIISFSGIWKIVVNGRKHSMFLYHKNTTRRKSNKKDKSFVPGYHDQKVHKNTIEGFIRYIIDHDRYKQEHPLYGNEIVTYGKRKKVKKKERNKQRKARRRDGMRYVFAIFQHLESQSAAL